MKNNYPSASPTEAAIALHLNDAVFQHLAVKFATATEIADDHALFFAVVFLAVVFLAVWSSDWSSDWSFSAGTSKR